MRHLLAKGFTLVELIVSIVIISIAVLGILSVYITTVTYSVDPMLDTQALMIGQAYLEEAALKSFNDPDQVETNSCEAGETRATYDDIWDYNCVNDVGGAIDQYGSMITDLSGYTVNMTVSNASINGIPTARLWVHIVHNIANVDISIATHKTSY